MRSKLLSRVEEIKQYLLWYIRRCGPRRGAHMLVTMESFRYGRMKGDVSRALDKRDDEKAARLQVDLEIYKAQMRRRCSPQYIEQYNTKGMKVAASEGLSPEEWIMWSMTWTAATCIRYHMPDDVLKSLACRYITDVALDGYKLDEHYGPNGVSDNYSWVPDVWDKRFEPYDVSWTGVRIDQWSFDFPIFITGDWNPNSGGGLHWADSAYKED